MRAAVRQAECSMFDRLLSGGILVVFVKIAEISPEELCICLKLKKCVKNLIAIRNQR